MRSSQHMDVHGATIIEIHETSTKHALAGNTNMRIPQDIRAKWTYREQTSAESIRISQNMDILAAKIVEFHEMSSQIVTSGSKHLRIPRDILQQWTSRKQTSATSMRHPANMDKNQRNPRNIYHPWRHPQHPSHPQTTSNTPCPMLPPSPPCPLQP